MTKFTFKGKNFRLETFNMYKEKYKYTHEHKTVDWVQ
jgi:hypothetical protein